MSELPHPPIVLISANAEWRALRAILPAAEPRESPLGQWFPWRLRPDPQTRDVIFFHGGWGKIAAAASTQYVVDCWQPPLLVNIGTCGGFAGAITPGEVVLVERALVYDIVEQMGDAEGAIAHYTTTLDLSWLSEPYPEPVHRGLLVSADRDLLVEDLPRLRERYGAVAGDWESGAVAYVASRNATRCLILRGVSDVVSDHPGAAGGEAYGNPQLFYERTEAIMRQLVSTLPAWLDLALPGS
jgi:adenosylhomocysteine nucleosidase